MTKSRAEYSDTPTVDWKKGSQPTKGRLALGRYRILQEIGGGGMGTVFKAEHVNLKQIVALKTIKVSKQEDNHQHLVDRFRRELKAIGAIHHTHVVRATDGGEEDGVYFLAMEFVDGIDLAKLVKRLGPLEVADACELIRQAALGLSCIHSLQLIHRDIKPSNLLLAREGIVKIADLGLARFLDQDIPLSELTPHNQILGTADFMAPEQARNARSADVRSDIYSLGCSLFCLLVGHPPFPPPQFSNYAEKLLAHQQEPIPRLQDVRKRDGADDVPVDFAEVDGVLGRMLAKAPEDRFADPNEVVAALEPLTVGHRVRELYERSLPVPIPASRSDAGTSTPNDREDLTGDSTDSERGHATTSRRRWQRWGLLGLGLLIMGALPLYISGVFSPLENQQGSEFPPEKPISVSSPARDLPVAPFQLDALPADTWHNLLTRPPNELIWPEDEQSPSWNPTAQEVAAEVGDLGILQFGETQAPNYKYPIELKQKQQKGGIGLCLGVRLPKGSDQRGRVQVFELNEGKFRKMQQFTISRGFFDLYRQKGGELGYIPSRLAAIPVKTKGETLTIEVVVAASQLKYVRVNGEEMPKLLDPNVKKHFEESDHLGAFGVILSQSEGTFRAAQFMRLSETP